MDYDALAPHYERRYERYAYTGVERTAREFVGSGTAVLLEVGCGTGHWLAQLGDVVGLAVGLDPSWGMLERAHAAAPAAVLARARAEALPLESASVDRVLCVNAAHHFADRTAFVAEARRVLRAGGGVMVIGLDPHTGGDEWWIYDYFPDARPADLARYPSAAELRRLMADAGLAGAETREAQHIAARVTLGRAEASGLLERSSTSQLVTMGDRGYADGVARIHAAAAAAAAEGEDLVLRADLRLYATAAWVPAASRH